MVTREKRDSLLDANATTGDIVTGCTLTLFSIRGSVIPALLRTITALLSTIIALLRTITALLRTIMLLYYALVRVERITCV